MLTTFDLLDFKKRNPRAGRVLAYLVLQRLSANKDRYVPLNEMTLALDLDFSNRVQWGRIAENISELLGSRFDTKKKTVGPWRLLTDKKMVWRVGKKVATSESISALVGLSPKPKMPEAHIFRRRLNAEACELMTSAERRYRTGAFSKAIEAVTQLERVLGADNIDLILAYKLRKLRILHRMNDWSAMESEINQLRKMPNHQPWPTETGPVLECLKDLYSAWVCYEHARPDAKNNLEIYWMLICRLSAVLPRVKGLSHLSEHLDSECKNLMILLRRRLLCEFNEVFTSHLIPSRTQWATEAENWSLETIEQAALNDDLDGMGNYCANFAYLLGSFRNAGLRTGDSVLIEAFQWMTVSDRIASRLGAGADNLWSLIYWLFLRRVAKSQKWEDICHWVKPIVARTLDGPHLPDPTHYSSCFEYVTTYARRIFSAHEDYRVTSHIPTQQVRMLLGEMCKVRDTEGINQAASTEAYEMVAIKWGLAQRNFSAEDEKKFADARFCLTRP